jgi:hypothetical protein
MTSSRTVEEWTGIPSAGASCAPAPASSSPNRPTISRSGSSANVTAPDPGSVQRDRRTHSAISSDRPPAAPSASSRR